MIELFLLHYRKTLKPDLQQQLANTQAAANPLFLRSVLEELRRFGNFEKLTDQMAFYLEAQNLERLFRRILSCWQQDFGHNQGMVKNALSFLWAARQGLSENEWLDLLGTEDKPLPRQRFTPLLKRHGTAPDQTKRTLHVWSQFFKGGRFQ